VRNFPIEVAARLANTPAVVLFSLVDGSRFWFLPYSGSRRAVERSQIDATGAQPLGLQIPLADTWVRKAPALSIDRNQMRVTLDASLLQSCRQQQETRGGA
jgi:hypothetical protein